VFLFISFYPLLSPLFICYRNSVSKRFSVDGEYQCPCALRPVNAQKTALQTRAIKLGHDIGLNTKKTRNRTVTDKRAGLALLRR